MWQVFLTVLCFQLVITSGQLTCPPTGLICVSPTEYQFCTTVNGRILLTGSRMSCPEGATCTIESAFPCQTATTTTTPPTTTTPATTTPPPTTTTTPPPTTTTTPPPTTTTPPPTTTTTTPPPTTSPPVTAPTCNQTAVYPGPRCDQYYQCLYVMWWWDYELLTCPTGQAFNPQTLNCTASTTCVTN